MDSIYLCIAAFEAQVSTSSSLFFAPVPSAASARLAANDISPQMNQVTLDFIFKSGTIER